MRFLLRLIAAWFGVSGLALLLLLLHLGSGTAAMPSGAGLALALLVVLLGLSLYSAVELWRLRERGRLAAIGVCVTSLAFTFVQVRSLGTSEVVRLGMLVPVMLVLWSPAAKRLCQGSAAEREQTLPEVP